MANLLGRSIVRSGSMSKADSESSSLFFAHKTVRESQKEMIEDGENALEKGDFLLAAAPTGIGKTAAALASALEISMSGRDIVENKKIIFMTGRQSQHRIIVDTVRKINSRIPDGFPRVKLVDIIGRESMCEHIDKSTGKCSCEEEVVEESRKGRRSDLREKMLEEPRHVGWSIEYGRQRKICAWATARSAASRADILVCDYNHIFIDSIRESSLPAMGIEIENSILIVDGILMKHIIYQTGLGMVLREILEKMCFEEHCRILKSTKATSTKSQSDWTYLRLTGWKKQLFLNSRLRH